MFEYQKLLLLSHQHYGMLASDEWMHSRGVIFIFLPSLSSVISRNTECAVWESCSYSDNGIGWHSWCSRNSRDADFVSFYFPFFFSFSFLVMVMWESKFSAVVVRYFKSESWWNGLYGWLRCLYILWSLLLAAGLLILLACELIIEFLCFISLYYISLYCS